MSGENGKSKLWNAASVVQTLYLNAGDIRFGTWNSRVRKAPELSGISHTGCDQSIFRGENARGWPSQLDCQSLRISICDMHPAKVKYEKLVRIIWILAWFRQILIESMTLTRYCNRICPATGSCQAIDSLFSLRPKSLQWTVFIERVENEDQQVASIWQVKLLIVQNRSTIGKHRCQVRNSSMLVVWYWETECGSLNGQRPRAVSEL